MKMDVYEAIRTRRSIRRYKPDPIPDEVLKRVLDAARLAPSANNIQPWKFIVVKDEKLRKGLVPACWSQDFIGEAPVVIVACGLPTTSRIGGYASSMLVDVAIAFDHLTLAARAEGLGTCWIGAFENEDVKKLLHIPKDVQVVAITPLGHPQHEPHRAPYRKRLHEMTAVDKFDGHPLG